MEDNWVIQFSNGNPYYNYNKILFISKDTGFVVGDNRVLLKTTNNGINWAFKTVTDLYDIYDIFFFDKTTGFSVGEASKMLKTTNGGENWTILQCPEYGLYNNIYFTSPDTGYLISNYRYEGRIYKSINGGNSWFQYYDIGISINKFLFLQNDQFIVSCDGGNLFKTTDSGISWFNKIKSVCTSDLRSVCFVSDKIGFIAGNGTALNTSNGGIDWVSQNVPSNENYAYIKFFDDENGYLAGSNLYKTTNSGLSWDTILNLNGYKYVKFHNIDTGYVLRNNTLYKTFNGGINWTTNYTINNVSTIYFLKNNDIGYAFNAYSTGIVPAIYDHNDIYRTSNNGVNWELLCPINNGWGGGYYSAITFLNENTGFITGSVGIRKTTNGGLTWGPNYQGIYGINGRFYFYGQNIGYVYCYNGLYKTTNTGDNWTQIYDPDKPLNSFYFNDNNTGYAVGAYGYILKTTNGGGIFVNVNENNNGVVMDYVLFQNYPNPFNPNTKIEFELPKNENVKLIIYDLLGREVNTLVNDNLSAGKHEAVFDGLNLSSGIYFYKLETENFSQTKRMILLK
ncbi:MAG: YCF48-related protein [Ignavibacteria bacterium]